MAYAFVLGGIVLLYFGGELVVRGSVGLAKSLGVSPLLIGLVVIAFGTSSPELMVAINAVANGADSIAVGNVVGSNIANILLVLAIGALLMPIPARGPVVYRDGSVVLGITGFFVFLAVSRGAVDQTSALVLVGLLAGYLIFSYLQERISVPEEAQEEVQRNRSLLEIVSGNGMFRSVLFVLVGIGSLLLGSTWLVQGATEVATALGVSEAVIAVSMVAVGTSLPELAAVIVASIKRHSDLVLGGILGSNIFNILIVLGLPGLFWRIDIDPEFLARDVWVMLGAALILIPFLVSNSRVGRVEGAVMLAIYAGYIYVLFNGLPPILQL